MRPALLPRLCRPFWPAVVSDCALLLEIAACSSLFGPQPWAWASLSGELAPASPGTRLLLAIVGFAVSAGLTLAAARHLDDLRREAAKRAGRTAPEDAMTYLLVGLTVVTLAAFAVWFLATGPVGPNPR
jgi:hypothetical protein